LHSAITKFVFLLLAADWFVVSEELVAAGCGDLHAPSVPSPDLKNLPNGTEVSGSPA
jgi:hypothetical protein